MKLANYSLLAMLAGMLMWHVSLVSEVRQLQREKIIIGGKWETLGDQLREYQMEVTQTQAIIFDNGRVVGAVNFKDTPTLDTLIMNDNL